MKAQSFGPELLHDTDFLNLLKYHNQKNYNIYRKSEHPKITGPLRKSLVVGCKWRISRKIGDATETF
jgi:hypothetical protein